MSEPFSHVLGRWVEALTFDALPADVIESTKRRVLDVIGLSLAGAATAFGQSVRHAALLLSPPGPCRLAGTGEGVDVRTAAFANGSYSQALEFDDTHDESIVHMSSPSVAAALALAEFVAATPRNVGASFGHGHPGPVSGRDLILAIALGNEISCRVGSVAPGQFHRLGFHPSGLFAPFGVTYLAGKLLGLDRDAMARAAGICGSFAAGILECWVDGTQPKFLHPGWAAQSGITAACLAWAGSTGPAAVFEGRFGLFSSHLQDPAAPRDLGRITRDLGGRWDSRNASFKPFPAAHVLHPYIDALLRLRASRRLEPADVARIDVPVAAFIVPIVCEPAAEKVAPLSDSHGRVSLQYTLAEALYRGELGNAAYAEDSLRHPGILALARRVHYVVDPTFPGPGRFKGAVRVTLADGRSLEEIEEHNRGSAQNPMTDDELRAKFEANAEGFLSAGARDRVVREILRLETLEDATRLVDLISPPVRPPAPPTGC